MSAPQTLRGNFSDLFGSGMLPVLEEIFRSQLALHPSRREQLFKTVKTDRDIYQSTEIHDMPLFQEVPEGTDYSYSKPRQGANKTIIPVKYGLGFSISEEAVEDGKFDFIADAVRKMAESAQESQEIQAMNIFNNGFTTETTADAVALFNTAHTLPSGTTMRNRLSSDADLSVSSLETMLQDFETQFVGDSGIIKNIRPRILLVAPSNKRYAMELIGSDLKADTPNNNMNSFSGEGLTVVSSPHLTDSDAWFMLGAKDETGLRIINRKGIETKSDNVFDNDSIRYKSRYREKVAAIHPYGVFGTTGA
jgi:phage major head subunit gpT-like protein